MRPWNVVVTCRRNGERGAIKELRFFGRFHSMGFRDVLVGHLEDRERFFEEMRKGKEMRDPVWRYVHRIVPVDEVFSFTLTTFRESVGERIDGIAHRVPPGPFYVRIERRGHKGEIPTQEVEKEMGGRIISAHESQGHASRVDFKEFLSIVAVETFGDHGGVGIIFREGIEKYPFLKVP
jgi:tRNA(Ser,Leu) C12 N-acetylase TAN1